MADEPTGTPSEPTPAPDLSQYIRTYAKDVAALNGKGNVGAIPAPKPKAKPEPKKIEPAAPRAQSGHLSPAIKNRGAEQKPKGETSDGVSFEATEQPYFEKTAPKNEEMNYGVVDVGSKSDADSIIEKRPSAVPKPATMAPVQAAREEPKEDRGAILARLKAKMGNYVPPAPMPAVVHEEPEHKESPQPISAPSVEAATVIQSEPIFELVHTEPTPSPKVEPAIVPAPEPVLKSYQAPVSEPEPVVEVPVPTPQAPLEVAPVLPPPPTPEPVAQTPKPLYREPVPTEEEMRAAAQPTPARTPEQAPRSKPEPVSNQSSERFHSYATDFTQQIDTTKATSFSVLAAEQDAGPAKNTPPPQKKRGPVLAIVLGVVLLTLSAGGAYGAYRYVASRTVIPTVVTKVPSLIFADESKELQGTGTGLLQSLAVVATESLLPGNVLITYIAQAPTGEQGVIAGAPAKGGQLIKALGLPAPDILLRNISEDSTVGVTHQGNETRPFFILRVSSYERTFAGMLTWEPLIMRDIGLLYPLYAVETSVSADMGTTTASTTPVTTPTTQAASRIRFEDAIVSNRDVRILRDTAGKSLVLYGYADKETLIIARDEAAFSALLGRLTSAAQ